MNKSGPKQTKTDQNGKNGKESGKTPGHLFQNVKPGQTGSKMMNSFLWH